MPIFIAVLDSAPSVEAVEIKADQNFGELQHELGEEIVASYLYQVHLDHWLEINGFGRFLANNDL